jgi:HSP20 family protein
MVFRHTGTRHPLQQFRNEMDRLLTGFLGALPEPPWAGRGQPAMNVWEERDALRAELEVPGVKNADIELSVVGNELSLRVERPDEAARGQTHHRRERPTGAFARVVRLPVEVDAERVEAQLRDGVLTITLPKAESAKPRKIEVASK